MDDLFGDNKFRDGEVLVKNFLLLAFAETKSKLYLDLVGTSIDMKTLIVYENTSSPPKYACVFRYTHNREICTVIPADYNSSGHASYLVVSKEKGEYESSLVLRNRDRAEALGRTRAIPLLLSYKDARPALLMQAEEGCYVLRFSKSSGVPEKEHLDIDVANMHPLHTSALVDVTGNLVADLVLETQRRDGRYLEVLENIDGSFVKSEELRLPDNIGPLCFADFSGSALVDVAFVSMENGTEYLNVLFNSGTEGRRFHGRATKIALDSILPEHRAVMARGDSEMPAGIFVADIFGNSVPQIVIAMKDRNSDMVRHVLLRNIGNGVFEPDTEMFAGLPSRKIASFCFTDITNVGAEGLLLNYYEDGNYLLSFYENTLADTKGYYIRAITCEGDRPGDDYGCALPGISYRYRHIENGKRFIGTQLAQSSFPHLQHPFAFFGLGSAPYLVELEGVGLPFYNGRGKVFTICQKIIPNSQVLLQPHSGKMKLRLNFFAAQNIRNVLFTLIVVLFANLVILSVLHIKNRRRAAKRSENMLFDFEAL